MAHADLLQGVGQGEAWRPENCEVMPAKAGDSRLLPYVGAPGRAGSAQSGPKLAFLEAPGAQLCTRVPNNQLQRRTQEGSSVGSNLGPRPRETQLWAGFDVPRYPDQRANAF